ncbi:MAG: hypothetical protein ACR2O0_02005 [Rhizobiaceae bacterium]
MLNALSSISNNKIITLLRLRNLMAVIAVTSMMVSGYSYSEAQARSGKPGYSARGHGGGKPRARASYRSKKLNVAGKRTGYYRKHSRSYRGHGRYNSRYRSGSVLRNPGRAGVRHRDRGRDYSDRGYRNNRQYGDRGRSHAGRRDGYRGRDDYRGNYRRHAGSKHRLYPGGKRFRNHVRRYDRYGRWSGYRDYGLRGGYDGFRRNRRGGRDYYRDIAGGALVITAGSSYQDPYYDATIADNEPILEDDCVEGPYCTIRLGPYLNSPKIITLYSGKGKGLVERLEGDVTLPPVN